ncbi:MAG: hypothetical protein ACP5I8_09255 [Phycisphaerae bacterium]
MLSTRITGLLSVAVRALFVLMGFLTLVGCQGPVTPYQNTRTPFPQVHLTSYGLRGKILVNEPIVSRVGDGQLDVVIPVRNVTGDELYLEFQYRFLNQLGAQVEETSGWNTLRVPAYSMAQIHFTSLTAAANFDCNIRRLP